VYKALDNFHHLHNNHFWKQSAEICVGSEEEEPEEETEACDVSATTSMSPPGKRKRRGPPSGAHKRLKTAQHRGPKVYVALKRIYVTSSPERILNELQIMAELRYGFFQRDVDREFVLSANVCVGGRGMWQS
jgi:hypothetical protein